MLKIFTTHWDLHLSGGIKSQVVALMDSEEAEGAWPDGHQDYPAPRPGIYQKKSSQGRLPPAGGTLLKGRAGRQTQLRSPGRRTWFDLQMRDESSCGGRAGGGAGCRGPRAALSRKEPQAHTHLCRQEQSLIKCCLE